MNQTNATSPGAIHPTPVSVPDNATIAYAIALSAKLGGTPAGTWPDSPYMFPWISAPSHIGAGVVFTSLALVAVVLRFWVRKMQKGRIGLDDWFCLAAWFLLAGMGDALITGAALNAVGYPTPQVPIDVLLSVPDALMSPFNKKIAGAEMLKVALNWRAPSTTIVFQVEFAVQLLLILCFGCIKLSILFFYRRIFVTGSRTIFDYATKTVIVIVILWTLAFFFEALADCGTHTYANWSSSLDYITYCISDAETVESATVISNLILDVIVFVLPFPVIWTLKMTTGRKLAVTAIFLFGTIALIADIIRVILYEQQIHFDQTVVALTDVNLQQTTPLYWGLVEAGIAVIAACLPTLHYIFGKFTFMNMFRSFRSTFGGSTMRSGVSGKKSQYSTTTSTTMASVSHPEHKKDVWDDDDDDASTIHKTYKARQVGIERGPAPERIV